MNIGPKMAFILRVYYMTETENADDIENDKEMVRAGLMSERERWKRSSTRNLARKIRQRDDAGNWPRDTAAYRYRRLRDGKVGRWGDFKNDNREGDTFARIGDEVLLHRGQTKH